MYGVLLFGDTRPKKRDKNHLDLAALHKKSLLIKRNF